ncbi:MAG: helix-turn-helix transcriptional regulator [Siphonobacter sp.]
MSIISENIRYLRNRNDLTQEQLARRIGTKRPNVGAYEEARANPPRETLIKLSQLFGITIDQLLTVDLRKIRDTSSLNLSMSTLPPPVPIFKAAETRPPVQQVGDTYFQPKSQVNLVAQRVMLRTINRLATPFVECIPTVESACSTTPNVPSVIALVRKDQLTDYITKYRQPEFLQQLLQFQWPEARKGTFRAFEVGNDFTFPGAIVVGEQVVDWFLLKDARHYLVITKTQGVLYRRVYNQLKIKNVLLLSSDQATTPTLELSAKDILELWLVRGFYSTQLPEPPVSVERVKAIVEELRLELDRVK